jgi:hypothetical protein
MRKFILSVTLGVASCVGLVQAADVVVRVAPPAPIVEHRTVAPSPRHVWVGGYHRWDGKAYAWTAGRWEVPPREHAVWVAPRWEHRSNGYVFVEGRWR